MPAAYDDGRKMNLPENQTNQLGKTSADRTGDFKAVGKWIRGGAKKDTRDPVGHYNLDPAAPFATSKFSSPPSLTSRQSVLYRLLCVTIHHQCAAPARACSKRSNRSIRSRCSTQRVQPPAGKLAREIMATVDYMDCFPTGPGAVSGKYMRKFWHPVEPRQVIVLNGSAGLTASRQKWTG